MASTIERIKEVVKDVVQPYEEVTEATSIESLYLDTLDLVAFIMDVEDEFSIKIDDASAQGFKTIGEVVAYVDSKESRK